MIEDDRQLLGRYVDERSESAFSELVRRHLSLVYYAALRRVGGDAHLADDVAQAVFVDLARKAPRLRDREVLAGWLYTSTRFAAAQAVRGERRRRTHEQEAHTMNELHATLEPDWDRLRPFIDEAMDGLNDRDREAVLLRFFENRPLAEVGARFSLSPDAARMRIDRALEKLRVLLAKRGIASGSAALATAFVGQSGVAAPVGLVARVVGVALDGSSAGASATIALSKFMIAGTVAVVGLGLTAYVAGGRKTPTADAQESSANYETAAPVVESPVEPMAPGEIPLQSETPALRKSAPKTVAVGATMVPLDFAALSQKEKSILKTLWDHDLVSPDRPPVRWGFRNPPDAPQEKNFLASAEALRIRGLVGISPKNGIIFFTKRGEAFCQAHAGEIAAMPPQDTRFRPLVPKED